MFSTLSHFVYRPLLWIGFFGCTLLLPCSFAAEDATQLFQRANTHIKSKQYDQALPLVQQAAEQGYAPAQYNLGVMYIQGLGIGQDYAQARKWLEKAATQGYASAQGNLGTIHAKGLGVPQNYALARRWFEKAATQGNAHAQFNLGALYDKGLGVPQDSGTAKYWFGRSCDSGLEDGCDESRAILHRTPPKQRLIPRYKLGYEVRP